MSTVRVSKQPSANRKLVSGKGRPFYATYRAVGYTCPSTCPLLNNGCYAQSGPVALHQRDRYSTADGAAYRDQVQAYVPDGAVVRLHVAGDIMAPAGPDGSSKVDHEYLQAIVDVARERPNVTFYGYTHAWRLVDRTRYGTWPANLVINASADTAADVADARAAGWPVTTVVASDTPWRRDGDTVVCPAQTSGLACDTCMLCGKGDRALNVAFKAHGTGRRKVDGRVALPTT